jgi:hypothetical protein
MIDLVQPGGHMSQNDVIVLNANFDDWKQRASDLTEFDPWLYFCVEQFTKPFALSDDEIQSGITDGPHDGGADAIYFLVNQRMLVQEDTELEAKGVNRVRLVFIQVKKSGGFKPTEIDKQVFLTDDFLDLSKPATSFARKYNSSVRAIMQTFKTNYLKVAGAFPEVLIDYYYTTNEDVEPDCNALDSANRVYSFLEDEPGVLAERIFESNVRGFQQHTPVNTHSLETLLTPISGC